MTQIDLGFSYEIIRKVLNFVSHKSSSEHDVVKSFNDLTLILSDAQLSHPEVKKLIRNEDGKKFELPRVW